MKKHLHNISAVAALLLAVAFSCSFSSAASAAPQPAEQKVNAGPAIEAGSAEVKVVADADIASFPPGARRLGGGSEQGNNAGAANKLKLKKFENRPILKLDFSKVPADATITAATLEVTVVNDRPLNHISVASLHADWNEGSGVGRDDGSGETSHDGACFLGPKGPRTRWRDGEEGDFNTVDAGYGGNAVCVVRAKALGGGKFAVEVDPLVVQAAREHGQSFVLTDETGLFDGDKSNAYIASREDKAHAPVLKVAWSGGRDAVAPAFAADVVAGPGPLAGSVAVMLPPAGDDGKDGCAVGYRVTVGGKEVPRIDVPRPQRKLRGMLLRDLPAGKDVELVVTAYDEAGNTCSQTVKTAARAAFTTKLAEPRPMPKVDLPPAHAAKTFTATLVDGLTLFDPTTGGLSPRQIRQYVKDGRVEPLTMVPAVRGEIVGLQCLVALAGDAKGLDGVTVSAGDLTGPAGKIPAANLTFFREHYVKMGPDWIADVLPPLAAGQKLAIPSQKDIAGQKMAAVYIDLLVDKATPAGVYTGEITVSAGEDKAVCPLAVVVGDVTLPDELSFVVEMNAYGHSGDVKVVHETFRLCHRDRLSYNVLGYGHSRPGSLTTPGLNRDKQPDLPGAATKVTDWSKYDAFYGPLFSGEVAKDLPRKGVPATHWYLPFHEGWPYPLSACVPELWKGRVAPRDDKAAYSQWVNHLAAGDPLVPGHFGKEWRDAGKAVAEQFSRHFKDNGWTKTRMQIFDNHKYYFASGSMSLWTMDEPQYGRDYRALDWIYRFFDEALAGGGINAVIRADVSRPEYMGNRMDDSLELMVVSSAVERYSRLLEDILMTTPQAELWWYGGGGAANIDPASYFALFLSRWRRGCDGGMPVFTTFSGTNEWSKTDSLRVVRFGPDGMPVPSFRMKAYRHGQQEMELLNLLSARKGFNRWHVRDLAAAEFPIKIVTISRGPDDPGYSTFDGLNIDNLRRLREKVVATLLAE